MKLLIIRHGESEADILNVHEGRADFELTERGHRQAAAMGEYVAQNYKIDRIYHSTLKRAAQTAGHSAEKTGAELIPCEQLMEFNNGLLAGLSHEEADLKYPEVEVPAHMSKYEQESAIEFRARAEYMLSKLLSENGKDDTIAVGNPRRNDKSALQGIFQTSLGFRLPLLFWRYRYSRLDSRRRITDTCSANFSPHNI